MCASGFGGEPCIWEGVVNDPEFADFETWTASRGAALLPLASGLGPGIATIEGRDLCTAGQVVQVVTMPNYEDAGPLVAEIVHRGNSGETRVLFGDAEHRLNTAGLLYRTDRFCLGEAAYGGAITIALATSADPACETDIGNRFTEFDRFEILPAAPGECPALGSVLNGSAEVDEEGWVFERGARDGVGSGALESDVGRNQSSGARLYRGADSDQFYSMGTLLSIPLAESVPSPALRFWWKGSPGWLFQAFFRDLRITSRYPLDGLFADGEERVSTYCLPPWMHGIVVPLWFTPREGPTEDEVELVVDDVEIVSEPRCGNSRDTLDGGFESAPLRWPGTLEDGTLSTQIEVLDDPELARPPGRGVLQLTVADTDDFLRFYRWVKVPESDGDRGPVVNFYSKVPADLVQRPFFFIEDSQDAKVLPEGGAWRFNERCLAPQWAGRWFRTIIQVDFSREEEIEYDEPKKILLDDFVVTTSAACPTE